MILVLASTSILMPYMYLKPGLCLLMQFFGISIQQQQRGFRKFRK